MWRNTSKWPYLSHMASKRKSEGTFFSLTLKVGEKKVHLFSRFDENLPSYDNFVVFSRYRTFARKSQNDKKAVSHSNDAK